MPQLLDCGYKTSPLASARGAEWQAARDSCLPLNVVLMSRKPGDDCQLYNDKPQLSKRSIGGWTLNLQQSLDSEHVASLLHISSVD